MAYYFGQTITVKLGQADTYYGEAMHIRHLDWDGYSENEQKASLLQAEREIDAYLGFSLEENYSTTEFPINEYSNFRPDYAVFEHALFLLENTARMRTATNGAEMIESEAYQEDERTDGLGMAPQAAVFLKLNRIQIQRG